jgi:hypothetical protein
MNLSTKTGQVQRAAEGANEWSWAKPTHAA